jgi:hypothetical protein
MPMAHACNPSYSGGRKENCDLKSVQANSSGDPILKIANIKTGWWSGSRCKPWVQAPGPKIKEAIGSECNTRNDTERESDLPAQYLELRGLGKYPISYILYDLWITS